MPEGETGRPKVFISHANEDADFAKAIRTWLDDALLGAVTFFVSTDRTSIPLGSEWPKRIREALENSGIMLVIVSPVSVERRWLYFEAGAGYVRDIPVVPICIAGTQLSDLVPPFSLLQAIQLPNPEGARRLIELVAKSAGLRAPSLLGDLAIPDRVAAGSIRVTSTDIQVTPALGNTELSRANARALLRKADNNVVGKLRKLLKEALLVMAVRNWSGNRNDAEGVLREVQTAFRDSVLIPKDERDAMLQEAEMAFKSWTPPEKKEEGMDMSGYKHVRTILASILPRLPSFSEYEDAIFAYAPDLYVPLLVCEAQAGDDDGRNSFRWNAIRILADSEYDRSALPFLGQTLAAKDPGWWDFKEAVDMARSILMTDFDRWYTEIRGRSYREDIEREEEKERRKDEMRQKEYLTRLELEREREQRSPAPKKKSD